MNKRFIDFSRYIFLVNLLDFKTTGVFYQSDRFDFLQNKSLSLGK